MFYLAVSCIALGLLCLLYLAYTLAGRRETAPAPEPAPGSHPKAPQAPLRPVAPAQPAAPARNEGPAENQAYREPIVPAPAPGPPVENRPPANRPSGARGPEDTARGKNRGDTRERITEFRRIDTDALADTLRVYSRREAPPREAEQPLIVGGVLYMNNSRYLPAAAGQSPAGETDFAPRAFANLRRVGQGTLVLEGGGFHIHCGNANYSYTVSDLEQIVFQDRGVALIPTRHDHAVPVFITEEPERIKNYIKKHAHIIHGRP